MTEVLGLYCYKCLAIDCDKNEKSCQDVIALLKTQLSPLYHLDKNLEFCPPMDGKHKYEWRIMQLRNTTPCPERKANEAACTLGRIQVKTSSDKSVFYTHATILGCAKRQLLTRLSVAKKTGGCDVLNGHHLKPEIAHQFHLDHCIGNRTYCYDTDYCLDWKDSVVEKMGIIAKQESDMEKASFNWQVVLCIVVGILAVILVGFIGMFCGGSAWPNPKDKEKLVKEEKKISVLDLRVYDAEPSLCTSTSNEDDISKVQIVVL